MKKSLLFITVFSLILSASFAQDEDKKVNTSFELEINNDHRVFFNPGLYPGQEQYYVSGAVKPEFTIDWADGSQRIVGDLFARLSSVDEKRSHWDVRELYYQLSKNNWEFSAGLKKIYWGVTESVHLVDVINQTDQVESFDGEAKLGQPMLHYTLLSNFGTLDVFFLPYHRWRTLPGENGRFRFPIVLEADEVSYENDNEEWDLGGALRYSNYFGVFDLGVSYIYHSNREPLIRANEAGQLNPYYEKMQQLGLDLQATTGSMLWKLEAIQRFAESDDFQALVAGGEYTFGNIANKGIDIGVLAEFLYDNREPIVFDLMNGVIRGSTGTAFQKDVFVGSRLAFNDVNDSSILFGAIIDTEYKGKLFSIEAERRFFNNLKVNLEVRLLDGFEEEQLFYFFRDDSFTQLSASWFF